LTTSKAQSRYIDIERTSDKTSPHLSPPDIFSYLFQRLTGVESGSRPLPEWKYLTELRKTLSFQPALQYGGNVEPLIDTHRVTAVYAILGDRNLSFRSRAERAVARMVKIGMGVEEVGQLPFSISAPILEVLRTCQAGTPGDWPIPAYELIGRRDLAEMAIAGGVPGVGRADSGNNNALMFGDAFRRRKKERLVCILLVCNGFLRLI
jgi:hypothetical protein